MSPFKWVVAAGLLLGAALGVGSFTFVYAKGASYLSDDPAACANCHVMGDHYAAWMKGSHASVATCNDCHTPPGTVAKYLNKAGNGFRHSLGFTTGNFPDPLRITPGNTQVTEAACRKCHQELTAAVDMHAGEEQDAGDELSCVQCHARVGHWVR